MAELSVDDVRTFTGDRLADADDDALQALLDAALAAARRYCGWHVTPVRTDNEVEIDGPGGRLLILPTLRLTELTALTEDGTTLDIAGLHVSRRGLVRKKTHRGWTCAYGAITATMTHGFTEEEAADWRHAVMSVVDSESMLVGGRQLSVIGPFQYAAAVEREVLSHAAVFDSYRLEIVA